MKRSKTMDKSNGKNDFDSTEFEKRLTNLKDTQDNIQAMSAWCLQHRSFHKKIVTSWLTVLKQGKQIVEPAKSDNSTLTKSRVSIGIGFSESWASIDAILLGQRRHTVQQTKELWICRQLGNCTATGDDNGSVSASLLIWLYEKKKNGEMYIFALFAMTATKRWNTKSNEFSEFGNNEAFTMKSFCPIYTICWALIRPRNRNRMKMTTNRPPSPSRIYGIACDWKRRRTSASNCYRRRHYVIRKHCICWKVKLLAIQTILFFSSV